MATFKIPGRDGWMQAGRGDLLGNLWATKNVDLFTNPGKLKLARPFKQVATASTLDDDVVEALAFFDGDAYVLTEGSLFNASPPFTSWSEEDTGPQNAQDMTVFDGQLVVTTTDDVDAYNGTTYTSDWWTARGNTALATHQPPTSFVPHVLEVIRIGAETLAVTDGNKVRAYTGGISSGAVTSVTVDFDSSMTACCIKSAIRKVWIGTYTEDGDQAYVYEWDGASTNYTQAFPVGAKAVLSMELIDNVPILVTERGDVKVFNGAGFTTTAQFPFATKPLFVDGVETGQIQDNNTARPIHPKGMKRDGNIVYIFTAFEEINDDVPVDERTPAGLWAYDIESKSLTHIGSQENESSFIASSPVMVINDDAGRIFLGGRRDKTSDEEGIWLEDLDDSTSNYGYFATTEMAVESVQDIFSRLYLKGLLDSNSIVVVKYRTTKNPDWPKIYEDVTWASGTQFNTTTDLSDVKTRFDNGERDEVEVTLGSGAGRLAHITNVTKSASTYSVTIDEDIGTASETCDVRVDTWKKIPKEYTSADGELKDLGIGEPGTWCQLKVELRGKRGLPEVREILVKSNNKREV